jgi:hypothetical protein
MDREPTCTVEIYAGEGHERRAVVLLSYTGVSYANAIGQFSGLRGNIRDIFLRRFENWVGNIPNKKHYHGWEQSQYGGRYQHCFVFKHKEHRFYGFLCHPRSPRDNRLQVCALVLHAFKRDWTTDETELRRAQALSEDVTVQQAIRRRFGMSNG